MYYGTQSDVDVILRKIRRSFEFSWSSMSMTQFWTGPRLCLVSPGIEDMYRSSLASTTITADLPSVGFAFMCCHDFGLLASSQAAIRVS